MATREIASTSWTTFCERFVTLNRGALMTVRKIDPTGRSVEVVQEMPFTRAWMTSEECNDCLFLEFEQDGHRAVTHSITEPIHIKVRVEGNGRKELQIDAEDGSTRILFRTNKLEELLEGF